MNDYNFIKDRYFFIEQKFKDQYYPLVVNNGMLSHSFNSNGVIYKYGKVEIPKAPLPILQQQLMLDFQTKKKSKATSRIILFVSL